MKHKIRKFIATLTLSAIISANTVCSTSVEAASNNFTQTVSQDTYQKRIAKGFLGKAYGVGGNRYVCNTYVEKALNSFSSTSLSQEKVSFKNISFTNKASKKGAPTSYDWSSFRVNIRFTQSVYDKETERYSWSDKITTTAIKRKNKGTKLSKLELGDVLVYGKSGGHVALYFGDYDDMDAVMERLIELGVYKRSDLKKQSDRIISKKTGRPVIRTYEGSGTYWRIHATSKGLLIDNAIVSRSSNGTSSFGRWSKTIPSGYNVVDVFW